MATPCHTNESVCIWPVKMISNNLSEQCRCINVISHTYIILHMYDEDCNIWYANLLGVGCSFTLKTCVKSI